MIKLLALAALVAGISGCATEGQPEATGNTASLSKEIPPPKKDAPHFDPPGHSLMKGETPGAVKEGAEVKTDVSAPAKRSGQ
jgi:hypothetical protein